MTLAALALVVKIAVPAGFMVADTPGVGFPLVLCTAQGAVVIDSGHGAPADHKAPQSPPSHESPCAFAGHAAAFIEPALAAEMVVHLAAYDAVTPAASTPVSPGRGLVAPPPPARGPPLTS